MKKLVYAINDTIPEHDFNPETLGGKGYGLVRMTRAGIPVPRAYIIPTDACREYMKDPVGVMSDIKDDVLPEIIKGLTAESGYLPLVSVRSGAKVSMPGMMDTILFVGLDKSNSADWASRLGSKCHIDSYGRLIEMYGSVVNGIERGKFEGKSFLDRMKLYKAETGKDFPPAVDQLLGAIEAVFKSWNNERAIAYRRLNNIPSDLGTAVVIQRMVFGNFNDKSGAGTLFTRNPSNGEPEIVGEFLVNAPGEDLVSGTRTPDPLSVLEQWNFKLAIELYAVVKKLETSSKDMQDVEFTIEDGKLYLLQTRNGKRTAKAAVRIAVDMLKEGLIDKSELVKRVTFSQFLNAIRSEIDPVWLKQNPPAFEGLPASTGVVSGVAVFSSADAINCTKPCILITKETTPDDIEGMDAAVGILTATGGATSHAAVVARSMDKPCVTGTTGLVINNGKAIFTGDGKSLTAPMIEAGTKITIDGATGAVWINKNVPMIDGGADEAVAAFIKAINAQYRVYRTVWTAEQIDAGADKLLIATYPSEELGAAAKQALLKMFEAVSGADVVIDLAPALPNSEDSLADVFGVEAVSKYGDVKIEALLEVKADKSKWKVMNLPQNITQAELDAINAQIKVLPVVDSLEDLIEAEGLCVVDFDTLCTQHSDKAVKKLAELKAQAGQVVRSFNIQQEIDPEALGTGAVFAVTDLQLLRSVLAK